ncbi:hypothetical protein [Gorillibacterium sp. sgz5001074]|uniref:hypothetical protein n=1 Tax=Gorillibacterium sp. sgz5001074 TaxID=3446695 RepID=UPI003F6710C2
MNPKDRETELKLELLESLVRSQKALTAMLEHSAAASQGRPAASASAEMERHMRTLVRCQQALAQMMSGIRIPNVRKGKPGKLWIRQGLYSRHQI